MTSIDDFLAELEELEKQKDTPPPPTPDLRVPFSFIEVGKSEVFEIRPQKASPSGNNLIDVTTVSNIMIFYIIIFQYVLETRPKNVALKIKEIIHISSSYPLTYPSTCGIYIPSVLSSATHHIMI
jgi:hypothetical protein